MLDFTYTKYRNPEHGAICVIWHKSKANGADCLLMNCQLAYFDRADRVWRFVGSNEIVDEDNKGRVAQYLEIPSEYHNLYLNKGNLLNRIRLKLRGTKIYTEDGLDMKVW